MKRINVKIGDCVIFRPNHPPGQPFIGDNETGAWLRAGARGTVTKIVQPKRAFGELPEADGYAHVCYSSDGAEFHRCIDVDDEGTG